MALPRTTLTVATMAVAAAVAAAAAAATAAAAFKLNVGGSAAAGGWAADDPALLRGASVARALTPAVPVTSGDAAVYTTCRYAPASGTFALSIPVPAAGAYTVRLHWAEVWWGATAVGARRFAVSLEGVPVLNDYDIFADVGASVPAAKGFTANVTDGAVDIELSGVVQNAVLMGVEVDPVSPGGGTPSATPVASPTSVATPAPAASATPAATPAPVASATPGASSPPAAGVPLLINAGGTAWGDYVADTRYVTDAGIATRTIVVPVADTDADALYHTFRYGKTVAYLLPLPAGAYDLTFLFAEVYAPVAKAGGRVFSIAAGDGAGGSEDLEILLSDFDIFAAVGAATAVRKTFRVEVGGGGLAVRLTASVQNVAVQAMEVASAAAGPPSPSAEPTGSPEFDHLAHAVIDDAPTVMDVDGDGVEEVTLTGTGSHTHRFEDGVAATLVRHTWTNADTEEVLGEGVTVKAVLPLGTTTVQLEVEDSGGDVHAAVAVVTVAGSLSTGAYCYYYAAADVPATAFPLPPDVAGGPKAVFAAVAEDLAFPSPSDFPSGPHVGGGSWSQRCVFLYKAPAAGKYAFSAAYAGGVALRVGTETVFAASSGSPATASGVVELAEGFHEAQLQYRQGSTAGVTLSVNGSAVPAAALEWDAATVVPVLLSLNPATGGIAGGDTLTVRGVGFYTPVNDVRFGDTPAAAVTRVDPTTLAVTTPASGTEATVSVTVATGGGVPNEGGVSNGLPYAYAGSCAPVKFVAKSVTAAVGGDQFVKAPTSIAMGPDGRVYVGLLGGVVQAFTLDTAYTVRDVCTSESVGASRSIQSLSFDPLAPGDGLVLYAASSILYYADEAGLPLSAWDNGQIVVFKPNTNGACLGIAGTPITGLPVGNGDHAVQGLEWTQSGELLIGVGGATNLGANVASKLGGLDETPLSAAVLIAPVHKPGFDGAVMYNGTADERYTVQTGGLDVAVYAAGLRNSYDSVVHTNGGVYATDNGPNRGFGDRPVGCGGTAASVGATDKLLRLARGGYYGHPNRNRARADPRQCTYHPPGAPATAGYTPPLVDLGGSSYNGLLEYMGNGWCGALKHELLVAKFSGATAAGETLRVRLGDGGGSAAAVAAVAPFSGLLLAPTARGALLSPQPQKNRLLVYEPVLGATPPGAPPAVTAVTPHRGPSGGGNTLTVGGSGFGAAPAATVGGAACTDVRAVAADGRSFRCTAPAGTPGGLVRVVVTAGGVASAATPGRGDYWYMEV